MKTITNVTEAHSSAMPGKDGELPRSLCSPSMSPILQDNSSLISTGADQLEHRRLAFIAPPLSYPLQAVRRSR